MIPLHNMNENLSFNFQSLEISLSFLGKRLVNMYGLLKFIYAKKLLTVIFFAFLGEKEKENYGNI